HLRIFLIKLFPAVFAMPDKTIHFPLSSVSFKYNSNGARGSSGAVGHSSGQEKHLSGFDQDVPGFVFVNNLQGNVSFDLVEDFLPIVVVIVLSRVGTTHAHYDEVLIVLKSLLVADGRL